MARGKFLSFYKAKIENEYKKHLSAMYLKVRRCNGREITLKR